MLPLGRFGQLSRSSDDRGPTRPRVFVAREHVAHHFYLIPECDTEADVHEVLRELCEQIFVEQLAGWFRDEETWPHDRSFDVFCRWFEFRHHSMLVDLSDEPLMDEQD